MGNRPQAQYAIFTLELERWDSVKGSQPLQWERRTTSHQRGVTLIEILLVIGIISVLIGITVPILAEARESAITVRAMNVQGQAWRPLHNYANDHRDAFPYFGTPGTSEAELWANGRRIVDDYWEQPTYWGAFLWQKGYDGHLAMRRRPSFNPPAPENRGWKHVTDRPAWAMFAEPELWREGHTLNTTLHQEQRWHSVRFSSRKGLLLRYHEKIPEDGDHIVIVTFADGHTEALLHHSDLLPGVPIPPRLPSGSGVLTTRHGLLGRDI